MADTETIATVASEEAIKAATAHAEAIETARKNQLEASVIASRQETKDIFVHAMREVLSTGEEGTKTLLLQKIPLLCTDMLTMKSSLAAMEKTQAAALINQTTARQDITAIKDNLTWAVRIVLGGVILAVLALLFK